jgi:hypothetical protein
MTVIVNDVQDRPLPADQGAGAAAPAFVDVAQNRARRDDGRIQPDQGRPPAKSTSVRPTYLRRPSAPSHRCRSMDMQRSTFLKFVACWGAGLVLVLASALVVRFLG